MGRMAKYEWMNTKPEDVHKIREEDNQIIKIFWVSSSYSTCNLKPHNLTTNDQNQAK